MSEGQFYEITDADVLRARKLALDAAEAEGSLEETKRYICGLAASEATDEFVRKHLRM